MNRHIEIPDLDIVRALPPGNRAWMTAGISDHHDALLILTCESSNGKEYTSAGICLRTRSGEGGYSYATGDAITAILSGRETEYSELSEGETVWRPAERMGGIIKLERATRARIRLTLMDRRALCSAILTGGKFDEKSDAPMISLEESMFQRFLRLGGAMKKDWENVGDPVEFLKGRSFEEVLSGKPDIFFA